jgi:CubicO group peptidase (beta-lactamase class C family)
MPRPGREGAREVVERAIAARIFPAAVVEVGSGGGRLWTDAFGTLTFEAGARGTTPETVFDLASLTKPIATTSVMMELAHRGALRVEDPVGSFFREWRGADREAATLGDLLEHASGLPARLLDAPPSTAREFEHEICTIRLEYALRSGSLYSDLGFILLGVLIDRRSDATLDMAFAGVVGRLRGIADRDAQLRFLPDSAMRRRSAPTIPMPDDLRRGLTLAGEVHDNYAAALGGVAGHAGLFGTSAGVGTFARAVLRARRGDVGLPPPFLPELLARFTARSSVSGSSRTLGWDSMVPTSSCGTRMSASAFGHVGFTGTSLWIDPSRDRYFVLLTNRVCGGGSVDDMRAVRRAFHDALGEF